MLRYLRENTGNWIIKIFLAIIVIVFVFLGVGSMNATRQDKVATVNDEPITVSDFRDAYKTMVNRMRAQFGNALNDDLLKALNVRQQAINSLIDQKILDMEAEKLKIIVSDQELQDSVMAERAFQKDGAFDIELYKAVLGRNGMTPETYEAYQRQNLKNVKLREMVLSGITVSDAEARDWYLFQNAKMAIDYIAVDPGTFTDVTPTAEQVEKQYQDNLDLYKSAPKRKAVYLVFSPEDHKSSAGVSEEQVKAFYEQNKADRFTTPEKVEASHILIKVAEDADEAVVETARKEAEAVYEKASKGEDFAELAKEFSQGPSGPSGGYLGLFERQSMVKPFGDAAFAMNAGEISKPVKTQFGWHVIKVMAKHQAKVEPFEDAAETIRNELEGQELQNMAYYKAGEAFDASMDGDDFEQVAMIVEKELATTPEFSADGQGLDIENGPEFARAAFELKNEDISEVKQIGNRYYLMRIVEKIEPKQLAMDTVKDQIIQTLTEKQQKEAAEKAANDLLEKAGDRPLTTLADEHKLTLGTSGLFTRDQAVQGIPASRDIARTAFGLSEDKPVHSEALWAGGKFYIIGFKEKQVPEAITAEENQDNIKQEIIYKKQQQYYTAWLQALKDNADIQINNPEMIN